MNKQTKILVVEDSTFFRRAITHALASEGFEVLGAASGEEALKSAQQSPDLILLDMHLPRLDGMMVLRILRGAVATRDIPVIILSANGMERDKLAAEKLGVSHYFRKDSSPVGHLVNAIRSTLSAVA